MKSILIDESRWPLVIITFQGVPEENDFELYLNTLQRFLQKKEKHIYLYDGLNAGVMESKQRKYQAEWIKTHKDQMRTYSLGAAIVISSPILRFVLASIFLLQSLPVPYKVFSNKENALEWIEKQLRKEGG